ncbi:putative mediator of RNA polymerase II transcription subunit 12 [Plodia interpunctella]|uniref:putative mediator of RNA polymerase II transcription subunit 12 n=1 Tax=Plodia interpunctella TaxID=58824 RepID=UPI0023686614|nr:putative mediator of RNA polymerase II transcription subunit 12 [Plodia interpunctella]
MTTHDVAVIHHQQMHHEIEVPVLNIVGLVPMHHQAQIIHEQPQQPQSQPQLIQQQQQQPPPEQHIPEPQPPPQQPHEPNQPVHEERKPKLEKKKKEAIDGQAREIIFKVIRFFESEKQNRGYAFPVENVVKRACAATGLSESTIKRIKRDGLRAEATQTKMTGPKKKRIRKTKVQLDYFQLCALRGIVNSYSNRKEVPTLGKILAAAKHELNYRGGKESLRLILLNKLGIKFKKCEKKNKKPAEPTPQPMQMPTQMQHPQMQQMKPMENQCVYTNLMPQVPPVSY